MFNIQSISMKSLLKEMKSPYYRTCKKTSNNEDDQFPVKYLNVLFHNRLKKKKKKLLHV